MGVWNEFAIDVTVPEESVAPLAAAIREQYPDDEHPADDGLLVAWMLYATEGGNLIPKPEWFSDFYSVEADGSLYLRSGDNGKLSYDHETVETLYARHGAVGTIDGEAEGEKYRVALRDGRRHNFYGTVVYPDDPGSPEARAGRIASEFVRGRADESRLLAELRAIRDSLS